MTLIYLREAIDPRTLELVVVEGEIIRVHTLNTPTLLAMFAVLAGWIVRLVSP